MSTSTKPTTRKSRKNTARPAKTQREDVYDTVTKKIVEQLEQGVRPWMQPWSSGHAAGPVSRPLRHNGERYNGINILVLWMSALERGFDCPLWLTFKQAQDLGGHVRKGEKSSRVVYASTFSKTEQDDSGDDVQKDVPFLKQYSVFNASQCEGLPERFSQSDETLNHGLQPLEATTAFVGHTNAEIQEGGSRAYYRIGDDVIGMPRIEAFRDAESHSATLSHELIHWTRHTSRLARDLGRKNWGDEGYAMEELVAELGAAFLCADLGITPEVRDDHAGYIQGWLKVLKDDKRAIFQAASMASKAVDYLHGLQPGPAAPAAQ